MSGEDSVDLNAELQRIGALRAAHRDAEALAASEALVRALPADLSAEARLKALNHLGDHLAQLGRRDEALAALREAREHSRLVGQPALLRAYGGLSVWHLAWGQVDEAESAARVAVQQARAWGDPGELGTALVQLGQTLARAGRADRALLALTEGIACLQKAGKPAREAEAALAALSSAPGGAR